MIFDYRIDSKYLPIIERSRKSLPVNIERLAANLGIQIESSDITHEGHIGMIGEIPTIYVNATQPEIRQRFTIAHEVAHYLIHREELEQKGSLDRDENPLRVYSSKIEAEANALAAEILMPTEEVDALLEYSDINTIEGLSNYLRVSEQAIRIKLKIPPNTL